ncbi:hypothetical protein JIN77_10135 [Verrucomicrobiaceae bacterium R5-34]|nr:hypothetical protein [Verrucomicrobiaceae bacterium R5-34]
MNNNILLGMALGIIGAATCQAANVAASTSSPITSTIVVGAGDSWEQNAGYEDFTVNTGGFLDATDSTGRFRIGVSTTGSLTIDGGAVTIGTTDTILLGNGHSTRTALIDVVSGSLTVEAGYNQFFIGRDDATGILRIQGGTTILGGMPTFDDVAGNGSIDFTSESTGSLTVAGADLAYYQGLYAGTDLTIDGVNTAAFGDVFSVTGSTITLVPEPSTALLGVASMGLMCLRRRRS